MCALLRFLKGAGGTAHTWYLSAPCFYKAMSDTAKCLDIHTYFQEMRKSLGGYNYFLNIIRLYFKT